MTDVIRPTRQRQVVSDALAELTQFRSAQEIHGLLAERGESVGLATVYRTLQLLADADIIDVVRSDAGEPLYRRCGGAGHQHHLVCRSCGKTVEIEGPTVERWADRVASDHGFTEVSHTLEIFGKCTNCG